MPTPTSRRFHGTALLNATAIWPRSGSRCWYVLDDLPAATRAALVAKLSDTLAQFVLTRNWLSADRVDRIASEARDRSTLNIAARSRGHDMRGLARHLRATGQLTAGLILRALLSGNLELFDHALSELSDLPQARVSVGAGGSPHVLP